MADSKSPEQTIRNEKKIETLAKPFKDQEKLKRAKHQIKLNDNEA